MDGKRFDEITRGLAHRRGFLKGLTGAAAGLIGVKASAVLAACRPGGYSCQRNGDCCSNDCYLPSKTARNRVCRECVPEGDPCAGVQCGSAVNNCGQTVQCSGNCNRLTDQCNLGVCHGNACYAVPKTGKTCGNPSDLCTISVCDVHGQCVSEPKCGDDPCIISTCDRETGACAAKDKCPPQGPCVTVSCDDGDCIETPNTGEPCGEGGVCTDEGECGCAPDCAAEDGCGDDGCGGSCGVCEQGEICNASGTCQGCSSCGNFEVCGSDVNGSCFAGCDSESDPFCFSNRPCASDQTCSSNSDCPSGEFCLFSNCCGVNVCVPPCSGVGGSSIQSINGGGVTPAGT